MNLEQYFRLIVTVVFQTNITRNMINNQDYMLSEQMTYDNTFFKCPPIHCMDGFSISAQIANIHYCSSENGYRKLGLVWETVEFGEVSQDEPKLHKYCEVIDGFSEIPKKFSCTGHVGRVPLKVLQEVCDEHGGINWDKTLSVEKCKKFFI